MALTSVDTSFRRVGPGQLYLLPVPATLTGANVPALVDAYYAKFYADGAAKKVLNGGVLPWCDLTAGGLNFKCKPSTVEFDPNNGPKKKVITGIDEASVEFEFYDVNPAHLADITGSAAADLIPVAAASGKAGRSIAVFGPTVSSQQYMALYRIPSPKFPGEYDHYLFPVCNLIPELDLKLNKKDSISMKLTMSLEGSPFVANAGGFAAVAFADIATAAGL